MATRWRRFAGRPAHRSSRAQAGRHPLARARCSEMASRKSDRPSSSIPLGLKGRIALISRATAILLSLGNCVALLHAQPAISAETAVLERVVRLLETRPNVRLLVVDPELAPDPAAIRRLDAFIVREPDGSLRPAIYINGRSELFEDARRGSVLHVAVLAAVIHHEAEHLRGGDEDAARRAELTFFESLILRGLVDSVEGHRYLADLERAQRLERKGER
jgi:hypothetical protein